MNEQKVTYGDPSNISVFEETSKKPLILENGKLLSNEPYAEDMLKQYSDSFNKLPKNLKYEIGQTIVGKISSIWNLDGSLMITLSNLRSRAVSLLMVFVYSLIVVAPIQLIVPLASSGLRMLDASRELFVAPPAPISVWTSSINNNK